MKKKKITIILLSVLIGLLVISAVSAGILLFVYNKWTVSLNINGEQSLTIEALTEYNDAGATATFGGTKFFIDNENLAVDVNNPVNTAVPGSYTVIYTAVHGKYSAAAKRTVTVVDTTPPTLTIPDDETIYIDDVWEDTKPTAEDRVDGDLSDSIIVKGDVDTSMVGEYTITYTVTDKSGNTSESSRIVTVKEAPKTTKREKIVAPEHKVVYLTFDDGPYKYTEKLLKILKKYDVKVTFFVTDFSDTSIIKKEYNAGHSIGVHTQSHDYSLIYSSREAFWADFNAMEDIIEKQTGTRTTLCRFPGGSSNTVSKKYCSGIMTQLVSDMENYGYTYFDWNVTSGDAGETTDSEQVYKNVIAGIEKHDKSIVLMHDTKEYTVDAVEDIIKWGLENGYTFCPLYDDSPTAHHGVNN